MRTKCINCGGILSYSAQNKLYYCQYCDCIFSEAQDTDTVISSLKERANACFLHCDFESAKSLYQTVVAKCEDSEAYWILALCEYGVQFVDEVLEGRTKRTPTCHRANLQSIFTNPDYIKAYELADFLTKRSYEDIAGKIDRIQKDILVLSEKEKPFDVFICYKETDTITGARTIESDHARELYHALDKLGYRTFFAPITLQGKAGQDYEPVIFTALNSARIMFVIAYTSAHYNAVWVKNEWSRFMERRKSDPSVLLVPCFNSASGSNPGILPREFGQTQMRDMAITGIPGLVEMVKKKIPRQGDSLSSMPAINKELASLNDIQAANLCKRGFDSLEEGDFGEAEKKFNDSADKQAQFSKPYWGLLLVEMRCRSNDELIRLGKPITDNSNYRRAAKNANAEEQKEYLQVINAIKKKITDVNTALINKRYSDILATGVTEQLETVRAEGQAVTDEYHRLIAQLKAVEERLKAVTAECSSLLSPIDKDARGIDTSLRDFYKDELEGRNESIPTSAYKSALKNEVVPANERLEQLVSKGNDIFNNSECFIELKELKQQQSSIIAGVRGQIKKLNSFNESFSILNTRLKNIVDDYDKALNDIPLNYDGAARLLGDIYNRINSELPRVPTLGSGTISSSAEKPSTSIAQSLLANTHVPDKQASTRETVQTDFRYNAPDYSTYDVILVSAGASKLNVIKIIREVTGLGLVDAKNIVESTPKVIKNGLFRDEALKLKKLLEDEGAHAEIN